ncbi:MAG: DNA pilot protein [Microvirus sp.]|nr:MAG: DNA pilot protein [Microvirus sp.]
MGLKKFAKKAFKTVKKVAPYAAGAAALYYGAPALAASALPGEQSYPAGNNPDEVAGGGSATPATPRVEVAAPSNSSYSPFITGGASLLGGIMANTSNAKQAQQQMAFQADQTGTAHQREVADLQKAGLNPILSGTGGMGASSASGASAQMQDILGPTVNSALATRRANAELENIYQQTDTAKSTENVNKAVESKTKAEQANTEADTNLFAYRAAREAAGVRTASAEAALREQEYQRGSLYGRGFHYLNRAVDAAEGAVSAVRARMKSGQSDALKNPSSSYYGP